MEIKGTAFEIIAQVNKLKQVKGNVFQNEKGERYFLNKFGFTPIEIWESETIKSKLSIEINDLKTQNINLKSELDDLDYLLQMSGVLDGTKIMKSPEIHKNKRHLKYMILHLERRNILIEEDLKFKTNLINEISYNISNNNTSIDEVMIQIVDSRSNFKDYEIGHKEINRKLNSPNL